MAAARAVWVRVLPGRAACTRQRRPCVPCAASGARPPLSSFPGSLAVSVCGSARAHKELRRRPALGLADPVGGGGASRQQVSGARGARVAAAVAWDARFGVVGGPGRSGRLGCCSLSAPFRTL